MKNTTKKIVQAAIVFCVAFATIIPASAVSATTKTYENPFEITAQITDRDILFSDSFESYEDFLVDDFLPWTTFDGDGGQTWGMEEVDWLNEYYTGSYMIFNPIQTTPPLDSDYDAHTGVKYMSCWDTETAMAPNDDWLFTPLLAGENFDSVSFWARSLNDQYGLEDFEVGVSTFDTNPMSFEILQINYDVPATWTQYSLDISSYSGQSIYIGIHCFSFDVFALFIDDFEVLGSGGSDVTPPITRCTLEGTVEGDIYTSDVTVTLTATDAQSGVNFTMYQLDDGDWMVYTAPFIVSEDGVHNLVFYSVDNAGNEEDEKHEMFTIQHALPVEIAIAGGFGVSVTIKNVGTEDLTNVDWTLSLDGSLIFVGKTKSGTIPSLAVGESITVKDLVIGFGKTGISAAVGVTEQTASGTMLLILVLGVA
jgi:hypothetical protein